MRAVGDIEALQDYIAKDSLAVSRVVGRSILGSIEVLRTFPRAGRRGRHKGTYELSLSHLPYIVAYKIIENVGSPNYISILAILHHARNRR